MTVEPGAATIIDRREGWGHTDGSDIRVKDDNDWSIDGDIPNFDPDSETPFQKSLREDAELIRQINEIAVYASDIAVAIQPIPGLQFQVSALTEQIGGLNVPEEVDLGEINTAINLLNHGVVAGLKVIGDGTSGIENLPNNAPKFVVQAGIAKIDGIQSLDDQIPLNTIIGFPGHATLPRIDAVISNTPGVFPPDPSFDTQVIQGTASATPVAPTLNDEELLLALIEVPALADNSSDCTIIDMRNFIAQPLAAGPVVVAPNGTLYRVVVDNDGILTAELVG